MGVPKPTEMTIRDLLQEELRKRGVKVVPEFSVSTPTGVLKPDILLKNGASKGVETKLACEMWLEKWASRSIIYARLNRLRIRF